MSGRGTNALRAAGGLVAANGSSATARGAPAAEELLAILSLVHPRESSGLEMATEKGTRVAT